MSDISPYLIKATVASISDIPFIKLNTIYLSLVLENDPRDKDGYEETKFLFTENDGASMDKDVETIFRAYVEQELAKL